MGNWHRGGGTGGFAGRFAWYFAREVSRGLRHPTPAPGYQDSGPSYVDVDDYEYADPVGDWVEPSADYGVEPPMEVWVDVEVDVQVEDWDEDLGEEWDEFILDHLRQSPGLAPFLPPRSPTVDRDSEFLDFDDLDDLDAFEDD